MKIESLLAVFDRRPAWAWVCSQFLPRPPACPKCGARIEAGRALESFQAFRRSFCRSCGRKFTPADGTPLHGTRWKPEDLVRLLVMRLSGLEVVRIGRALKKSPAAVRGMIERVDMAAPGFLEDRGDDPPVILPGTRY